MNLGIMGKSNQAINVLQYKLVASLRYVTGEGSGFFFVKLILAAIVLIAIIYWFFGTELGAAIRATGCNPQMASAQGINTSFNKVLALTLGAVFIGAIIYYIVIAFVLWLKMPSDYMKLFSAVAITFS